MHLLFDMQDRQEQARRSVESEGQTTVPDRPSGQGSGSSEGLPNGLPATLPDQPGKDRIPSVPTDPTPEAPKRDNKCPRDDDDEITEVPNEDKPAEPPKKKKKKKKNKDSKEAVPTREGEDDGTHPSTSAVEPEEVADEATPVPVPTEVPAEETKAPKKKKKHKKMPNSRSSGKSNERPRPMKCPRSNTGNSSVNRISGPFGITESPFPVPSWKASMERIIKITCWEDSRRKTIT